MEKFNWISILSYCLFSFFVFYQQLHAKNFKGANQIFLLILNIFAFLGFLVGIGYLIIYGYKVTWWAPVIIFIIGIIAIAILIKIEKLIDKYLLSLLGFIAIPIFAYLMFKFIPV